MKFLNGITPLLVYQLVGEISVLTFELPIPGPVLGMLLLFITLLIRRRGSASLDQACTTPRNTFVDSGHACPA